MGQYESGKWLIGLALYYFAMFVVISSIASGLIHYGIATDARFNDPGFVELNEQVSGSCGGNLVRLCGFVLANDNQSCTIMDGCSWDGTKCEGIMSAEQCSDYLNATVCAVAQCTWTGTVVGDTVDPVEPASMSVVKTTFSLMTGIGAEDVNIGIPTGFTYVFAFVFFWIPFVVMLWALYMALPFLH